MSYQLPSKTDVLVVGAGPVGLTVALYLQKAGMHVTIVEQAATNPNGCRAVVLHANTLENLAVIDAAEPIIAAGSKGDGAAVFDGSKNIFKADVAAPLTGKTPYPFGLLIPQQTTERVLEQLLNDSGLFVNRSRKVNGFEDVGNEGIEVSFENGGKVRARYLIGTDGSRSTIRSLAGLSYTNPQTGAPYDSPYDPTTPGSGRIVLSDLYFSSPVPQSLLRNRICGHLSPGVMSIVIPLNPPEPSSNDPKAFYRFITFLRDDDPNPTSESVGDPSYLQGLVTSRLPTISARIAQVVTASRYRVRSAVAEKFFVAAGQGTGKILLAGDSAHCHSPAGAQGLNLGLCDAVALGRAVALHRLQTSTSSPDDADSILEAYAAKRRATALEDISLTENLSAINSLATTTCWRKILRNAVLWVLSRLPFVRHKMSWRISGLVYRDEEVLKPVPNVR